MLKIIFVLLSLFVIGYMVIDCIKDYKNKFKEWLERYVFNRKKRRNNERN